VSGLGRLHGPSGPRAHVEPGHPDADRPLLARVAEVFAAMGGEVVITSGDDNLIRARQAGDPGTRPWVIVASGLPNLLHELVHAVQVGFLADDHGLDYGQIPYDLARPEHRRILWDETAACVLSCAWGEAADEEAWFAEQIGIQGVFYGYEEDAPGFYAAIDRVTEEFSNEIREVHAGAYAEVERRLRSVGAPPELARPRVRLTFGRLWARYRAGVEVIQSPLARP
jgi:hypothetical protein